MDATDSLPSLRLAMKEGNGWANIPSPWRGEGWVGVGAIGEQVVLLGRQGQPVGRILTLP
jgi:hypothetical protein